MKRAWTNARRGVSSARASSNGEAPPARARERVARRLALASIAKVAFALGEGVVFPLATEFATRPRVSETNAREDGWVQALASAAPATRDARAMGEGKRALEKGDEMMSKKQYVEAIEEYERVREVVPREYKMNQRAWLSESECYRALGDERAYLEYKSKVWWWGRGVRWPGWYIIAYLSARSAYFDYVKRDEPLAYRALAPGEPALVVAIWFSLLYLLVTYGLPDY